LRKIFRAKFRDALRAEHPKRFAQVPPDTWTKTWNVNGEAVGDGRRSLKSLAASISRVALSNRRLVSMQDGKVPFRYKPHEKPWTTMTLPAITFMQRFLQHVVPKGFQNVRYVGFLYPSAKTRFNALKEHLQKTVPETHSTPAPQEETEQKEKESTTHTPEQPGVCPHCGGPLRYIGRLPRCPALGTPEQQQRSPP
jgi:hypothetical protein